MTTTATPAKITGLTALHIRHLELAFWGDSTATMSATTATFQDADHALATIAKRLDTLTGPDRRYLQTVARKIRKAANR